MLDGLLPHPRQELADGADPDRDLDAPLGPRKVFVRLVPTDPGYHLLLHGGVQDGLENVHLLGPQQAETLGEAGVQQDDLNLAVSESLDDPLLGLRGHAGRQHPVLDPRGLEKCGELQDALLVKIRVHDGLGRATAGGDAGEYGTELGAVLSIDGQVTDQAAVPLVIVQFCDLTEELSRLRSLGEADPAELGACELSYREPEPELLLPGTVIDLSVIDLDVRKQDSEVFLGNCVKGDV